MISESATSQRDQIVVENLSLVRAIAIRVHESLPVHVDLDDLVHAGIMGLMDAAGKYDASKEIPFRTYAKHRIRGAILDSLRQADWASRDLRRRHKKLEAVVRDLSGELDRQPSDAEVAVKMGVEVERWRQMAIELRMAGLVSASSHSSDSDLNTTPEFPAKPDSRPDRMCQHSELSEKLRFAMGSLPERYRAVVTMYYTKEMTMKEIGAKMEINESRVSQIHKNALEKMAAVLTSCGIQSADAII